MTAQHEHDLELIMALAEGSLDPRGAEVRARLDQCPECLEDLRLQRSALAALRQVPDARLDDLESARLHRDLYTALGHRRDQPVPAPAARRPRRIAWAPLVSAAAVLIAVVLVAPRLDLLGSDDDASDDAPAFEALTESDDAGDEDTEVASGATEEQAEDTEAPEALQPMAADDAATTTAAADDWAALGDEADAGNGEDEPLSTSEYEAAATLEEIEAIVTTADDESEARRRASTAIDRFTARTGDPGSEECTVEGALFLGVPVDSYTLGSVGPEAPDPPILVTVHTDAAETTFVVSHNPDTCAVLDAYPEP